MNVIYAMEIILHVQMNVVFQMEIILHARMLAVFQMAITAHAQIVLASLMVYRQLICVEHVMQIVQMTVFKIAQAHGVEV